MSHLSIGTQVQARGLKWQIIDRQPAGQQQLYRLLLVDGPLRGLEKDILYPLENIEPIINEFQPEKAAPLPNWLVYHQAFLLDQALGPTSMLAAQPGRLRQEPYQLVPVLRALQMGRVRLLLADGVGLGKTIQAGLIVCELMARRMAHRILVVSPAGPLLEQWKNEFSERFGIRLEVLDRSRLEEIRRSTELGANPFDHIALGLASIDFLKQERVLELLERSTYDVIIIDEAHHCMDLGVAKEKEDSQRRKLAEVLASRCDALLLATATPHDGSDRSFASLCELLDPSLINEKGGLRGTLYRKNVIRRLKKHIVDPNTGQPQFRERKVLPCPVELHPNEQPEFCDLQRGILELITPVLKNAFRNKQYSEVLAFIALLKRSVSTVAACQATLITVYRRLSALLNEKEEAQEVRIQRIRTLRDAQRRLEKFGVLSFEEENEIADLEAEQIAQQLNEIQRERNRAGRSLKKTENIVHQLEKLIEIAGKTLKSDLKINKLIKEIQTIRTSEPLANILVYTEYTDSQEAVIGELEQARLGEVLSLSGADPDYRRMDLTDRFRTEDNLILVSTDATAEGLNLHQRCHNLIHLELPFNPNRLEQRNGRIDRYGQTRDPVVRYLYLCGTFEERILLKLIAKYERQRKILTFMPNTLGMVSGSDAFQDRLLAGLIHEEENLFQSSQAHLFDLTAPEASLSEEAATRELLEEIDKSLKGFEQAAKSSSWLVEDGLNAEITLSLEAERACQDGRTQTGVVLSDFVLHALMLDNASINEAGSITSVLLPPVWRFGLDDLPGYDKSTGRVLLTTDMEVMRDPQGNSVGFLGRSHPLVRRALDRVRSMSLGSTSVGQDLRVSAVSSSIERPELLFTFLARVINRVGHNFEQLFAVRINQDSIGQVFQKPEEWMYLASIDKAIRTTDIWKNHFVFWGIEAAQKAQKIAYESFAPVAQQYIDEQISRVITERQNLDQWLAEKSREITGEIASSIEQISIFDTGSNDKSRATAAWQKLPHGTQRLEVFNGDRRYQSALRKKAQTYLHLYKQRMDDIETHSQSNIVEVSPLGLLMMIPEVSGNVS